MKIPLDPIRIIRYDPNRIIGLYGRIGTGTFTTVHSRNRELNVTVKRFVFSVESGRRYFIGGSDARIIMGNDEAALLRLWREKRGEAEPEDLSGNLVVQLGVVTEDLNRRWYEANTGQVITDVQRRIRHPSSAVDGGDARWPSGRNEGRLRGQVYAAVVVL